MKDEQKFEIERAFDLLPHVVGGSWATIWFRLNQKKNPTREEFREKVAAFDLLYLPLVLKLTAFFTSVESISSP